jgi:hypothetical protein
VPPQSSRETPSILDHPHPLAVFLAEQRIAPSFSASARSISSQAHRPALLDPAR